MKSFRWTSFAAVAVFGVLAAATAQYVNGANEPAGQDLPLPADSPGLARAYEL